MSSLVDDVKSIAEAEKEDEDIVSSFYKEYLKLNSAYIALIQTGVTQKRESQISSFSDSFKQKSRCSYLIRQDTAVCGCSFWIQTRCSQKRGDTSGFIATSVNYAQTYYQAIKSISYPMPRHSARRK